MVCIYIENNINTITTADKNLITIIIPINVTQAMYKVKGEISAKYL